jgi:hypothetical protein
VLVSKPARAWTVPLPPVIRRRLLSRSSFPCLSAPGTPVLNQRYGGSINLVLLDPIYANVSASKVDAMFFGISDYSCLTGKPWSSSSS